MTATVMDSAALAARRTGLAFQRTRMAAERTLMAILRTSLSLISFGFGLVQFLRSMHGAGVMRHDVSLVGARRFGLALVLLGTGLTFVGIAFHVQLMRRLRNDRRELVGEGVLRGKLPFPISLTLLAAFALLALGVIAAIGLVFHAGPFS